MSCKCENNVCGNNKIVHECQYERDGYGFYACIICRSAPPIGGIKKKSIKVFW
jgi:hypothetical protein